MCAVTGSAMMKYKRYSPTKRPMNENNRRIFFRVGSVSIIRTANGTNIGHSTWENIEYAYVAMVFRIGEPNVTHTAPSTACWIPNNSGMLANGSSGFFWTFAIVKPPTTLSVPPAAKLAAAEKHISFFQAGLDPLQ